MTLERRWLNCRETAEYLGLAVKSVYDMIAQGKLPAARVGRLVRVDLRALISDLEAQVNGTPAAVRVRGRAK